MARRRIQDSAGDVHASDDGILWMAMPLTPLILTTAASDAPLDAR